MKFSDWICVAISVVLLAAAFTILFGGHCGKLKSYQKHYQENCK